MSPRSRFRKADLMPTRNTQPDYPLTAIVGQEEMKLALLLNVIDPVIGGVLIMGHRGTGKSTAVRAMADLLPQVWKVTNCQFGCDPEDAGELCRECSEELRAAGKLSRTRSQVPVVTLPLGATEDRVCGTIDVQRALQEGVKAFEPGLLARANRGFLYVDEVNLLEDHLVDLLLDVAVTGQNKVEREGISLEHPARFVLVGSGNPEEGELRPQLVDRFGLCAEVQTIEDLDQRVEIVNLREAFNRDAIAFRARFEPEQQSLRRRLARARKLAGNVSISNDRLRSIASLCLKLRIDGHRGELTIARTARALAAFEGRREVVEDDIRRIAPLALRHRLRKDPLDPMSGGEARLSQAFQSTFSNTKSDTSKPRRIASTSNEVSHGKNDLNDKNNVDADTSFGQTERARGRLAPLPADQHLEPQILEQENGLANSQKSPITCTRLKRKGTRSSCNNLRGRYSRAVLKSKSGSKIAIDATLRAKAMNACRDQTDRARIIDPSDLRFKSFRRKHGTLYILAIDTSGSMAANRIERAKGALVWLLNRSYIKRDRVALVSFRGEKGEELLQPSQSMPRARRLLDELFMGGATPFAAGIVSALNIAARAVRLGTERIVLLVFTDGRPNVSLNGLKAEPDSARAMSGIMNELDSLREALRKARVNTVIIDTQNRFTSGGEGRVVAERLGARYVKLPAHGAAEDSVLLSVTDFDQGAL